MAKDRWDGKDLHIYEYSAETPERYCGMDAYTVAEAYVYNQDGFSIGYVYVVSAQDLNSGVTMKKAIEVARHELRKTLHKDWADGPYETVKRRSKKDQTFLMSWHGPLIRQIL